MVTPKYTPQNFKSPASRQFTDRESFVDSFNNMIKHKQLDKHSVLVFYGVGGIGKSSLRKKLSQILEHQEKEKVLWSAIDMEVSTYREPETALFFLRKDMKKKYGVQFTIFDIAYTIYWKKAHPNKTLSQENFPLMEDSGHVSDIISFLGEVPVVGIIPKILNLTYKGMSSMHNYITSMKNDLFLIEQMSPNEILNRLPYYWALDLKYHLETNKHKTIIFIDTYEALWENNRTEGNIYTQDEWIRELIANLAEVMWVICGREKLIWEERDGGWKGVLEQHLLGKLSEYDARDFLKSCGIEEEDIQNVIIQSSKGVPYFLDLAVDTFEVIKKNQQREPKPEDFASTPKEIFDRFIKYLDTNEIETLKVLSSPRFWTEDIFEKLVNKFNTGFPSTAHAKLSVFSFINKLDVEGLWDMHQLMRESIQQYVSNELKNKVHKFMFDYYNDQLLNIEIKSINDSHKTAIKESYYHSKNFLSNIEILEWFEQASDVFIKSEKYDTILPIFDELINSVMKTNDNPLLIANNIRKMAEMYNLAWKFDDAQKLLEKAITILEVSQIENHLIMADVSRELAIVYYSRHCELDKAESLLKRAVEICDHHKQQDKVVLNIDELARLYRILDRNEESINMFDKALQLSKQLFGEYSLEAALAYNSLGYTQHKVNNLEEAEKNYLSSLAIKKDLLGEEHRLYARTLNNLGRCYFDSGQIDRAEEILNKSKILKEKVCGLEHHTLAAVYHDLGNLYHYKGMYPEAKPFFEKAILIRERYLGRVHPGVGDVLIHYASLLFDMKEYNQAMKHFEECIEIYKSAPGLSLKNAITAYNGLIITLKKLSRQKEAEIYQQELNQIKN